MRTFSQLSPVWSRCVLPAALAFPMFLAGCAGNDTTTEEDGATRGDGVATENANDKIAFEFFVGKGLTPIQAAGIVGNLDQESGMSPTISQYGGGPGRGIAQWSAGGRWDTSHHDNAVWFAGQKGESVHSLNLQLEFIWYELTSIGYGFSQLKAAKTVTAATVAFQDLFEICGACDSSNRIAHAKAALADFGAASPGPATPVPPKPSGCGTIDPGKGLVAGETYESCDGHHTLSMQTDGNLVLYHQGTGATWSTHTNGKNGYVAVMQADGNFVLYDHHSHALWASGTNGHTNSDLAVQDDGNLVVYHGSAALWASHTSGK